MSALEAPQQSSTLLEGPRPRGSDSHPGPGRWRAKGSAASLEIYHPDPPSTQLQIPVKHIGLCQDLSSIARKACIPLGAR